MNAQQTKRFRSQLEALRTRLRTDARKVAEQALGPSGGQGAGELSNTPFHLGDEGSEEFFHDMSAALAENETFLHREVDDALGRLDNKRFGKCESCGGDIGRERLEAIPYARYCIKCADANQSGLDVNLDAGRPRTPADMLAPEGAMRESWTARENPLTGTDDRREAAVDEHAAGEPGGGGASGGLAGSNSGDGEPEIADLQDAAGSGKFDADEGRGASRNAPRSGRSGGAVGGSPAQAVVVTTEL